MKSAHRSLLFWLGLLPAIFILWAWFDSYGHVTNLNADLRGRDVQIGHYWRRLDIQFTHEISHRADWNFSRMTARLREREVRPPRFIFETIEEEDPELSGYRGKFTDIAIPHWMLFTAWLILFLIVLGLRGMMRHKRSRSRIEGATPSTE